MLDVENYFQDRYPAFWEKQPLLAKPLTLALKLLFHEQEFRQLEEDSPHLSGFDFVERVLDYFEFSYRLRDREWERIPPKGKVVIVANHPIGTLDGLVLLKLVREIRPDVKVIANDVLSSVQPLGPVLLPVDNIDGKTPRKNLQAIQQFLKKDGALIIFPAGEVSRFGAKGVRDGKWNHGFLRVAAACKAPILPIHVDGRNSAFFYALSFLAKPLSTLWLVREMFKQAKRCVDIRIGEPISYNTYQKVNVPLDEKARLFQRHLYRIGNGKSGVFNSEKSVAHPEKRLQLRDEIRACERLGETGDNKQIYLYKYSPDSCILREIGRLRELTFRAVDEGSGQRRDLDVYDKHYVHLILWDDEDMEIAGAYRLCDAREAINKGVIGKLYSSTLFDFTPAMTPYLEKGLELGRSFVQPKYWGRRSLDYLWYGIGAYLRQNPQYRYLFGPVSLSDAYPEHVKNMLVHFYERHFSPLQHLADAKTPFRIGSQTRIQLSKKFPGTDYRDEFIELKSELANINLSVPTLYKQYSEICDVGGVQFASFNIDPNFSDCVDGLVIVDLARLKQSRRKRYIG